MTLPKDHNNLPVIDLKQMEICNVSKTEFKMEVLRKLNDLQENTKSQHGCLAQSVKQSLLVPFPLRLPLAQLTQMLSPK